MTTKRSTHADRADVVGLELASGISVELMRTWYRTQSFARHTHDYFTLGVVLRGSGTLWIRGSERMLHRGDVCVIPPGEVHTVGMGHGNEVLSYFAVHVPVEALAMSADAQGRRRAGAPAFATAVIRDGLVGAELRRLNAACGPSRVVFDEGAANDALIAAMELLVRRHGGVVDSTIRPALDREPELVRITCEIIDDCYADNTQTSLRALARRAGVTPCHLVRAFTDAMGLSPHRYLVQTRVRRASQYLARGIPASFVAAMTGFADQSHLTTQFKRYVGTTPASYQRGLAASSSR